MSKEWLKSISCAVEEAVTVFELGKQKTLLEQDNVFYKSYPKAFDILDLIVQDEEQINVFVQEDDNEIRNI